MEVANDSGLVQCANSSPSSHYSSTHRPSGSANWTAIPPLGGTSGKALSEDYNVIQSGLPNPVPTEISWLTRLFC